MASRDAATEKQLVLLLSQPLEQYGVVTSLGLDYYAQVLALLRPPTQKVWRWQAHTPDRRCQWGLHDRSAWWRPALDQGSWLKTQ